MFQSTNKDTIFTIGNNSHQNSKQLSRQLRNKALKPDTEYYVDIVLVNKYKNKKAFNDNYEISARTEAIPNYSSLFSLLVLLIIPVILFLLYR